MENCGWIYFQGGLALMDAVNSHVRDSLYNVFSNIKTVHAHVENVKRLNFKAYFFPFFFPHLKYCLYGCKHPEQPREEISCLMVVSVCKGGKMLVLSASCSSSLQSRSSSLSAYELLSPLIHGHLLFPFDGFQRSSQFFLS